MNMSDNTSGSQSRLYRKLQELSFALIETHLYLDTHPTSRAALDYYRTTKAEYDRLVAEYEASHAPVTPHVREGDRDWRWVREPWPWELGFPESGEATATVSPFTEE